MMYRTISDWNISLNMSSVCSALGVNRSGYSDWLKRKPAVQDPYEMKLRDNIQKIALDFPRYGYRRITAELHRRGFLFNHKRVLGIMREDNLLCA